MKFLIVDDHELIREGLRLLLGHLAEEMELVEASSVDSGLVAIRESEGLDLAILDMILPDGSGTRLMDELGRYHPEVPMIVVSAENSGMEEAFRHGAMGFIVKSALNATLLDAIRQVLEGGVYIPMGFDGMHQHGARAEPPCSRPGPARCDDRLLTDRQREVLALMMRGMTNKSICKHLDLAESTVKIHVSAILRTLQVSSRTQAVLTAAKLNLV